jgi:hypothetical protein
MKKIAKIIENSTESQENENKNTKLKSILKQKMPPRYAYYSKIKEDQLKKHRVRQVLLANKNTPEEVDQ